jgi:cell pole-organizing protein PopZ
MFSIPEPAPNGGGAKAVENDILDLTESMEAPPESAPAFRRIDGSSDVTFNEPDPMPEPAAVAAAAPTVDAARRQFQQRTGADRTLLSPATTDAVDSAFDALAQTVLVQNSRTLDDLVREMLRPMLKAWLDDNLPTMVERLVRAEIERVSRGR